MKRERKQLSGGARLKEKGETVVTLGLDAEEVALIDQAAAAKRWPRATYIRYAAIDMAREILKKKAD